MSRKKKIFISLAILAAGALITLIIFLTEPTAQRSGVTKETAMLVDVVDVTRGDFVPEIRVTGIVEAAQDIMLSPRVSGEIIYRSENFVPGGFVKKGQTLLRIDPADYRNILELRKSDLNQALADLNLEMGRQTVAQKDFELIGDTLSNDNRSLVLREPQLNAARSRVEAAQASYNQAQLELDRTSIRAPFDAQIIERNVNVGSQVSPGQILGRLVGIDEYWVIASLPLSRLKWISFANGNEEKGSTVKVQNLASWKKNEYRNGYVSKLIGALEENTRLSRVLITIPDPLAHKKENNSKPPLIIGAFMDITIQGTELNNVIRLNRDYLRKNESVWVMKDSLLQIRNVSILMKDARYAYIDSGLYENEQVVTTNLSTVVDSARLRVESANNKTDSLPSTNHKGEQ